ncbi:uncharacterized protein LOC124255466 [Haliotis rubra]|uniref:uncharacterized protein LOC124255466 n=1 Tax=Haliotis rubra TaxID=36100 RepID=UPI001EE56C76|nr:uncharacterized protein LOC124255466 [Haliotis rubra]
MPGKRKAAINHWLVRTGKGPKQPKKTPAVAVVTGGNIFENVGPVPQMCASSGPDTNTPTGRDLGPLDRKVQRSMSSNTWSTYHTSLQTFHTFRRAHELSPLWPAPIDQVVHFISYLSVNRYSSSTAKNIHLCTIILS